jgi:hypothetical protein
MPNMSVSHGGLYTAGESLARFVVFAVLMCLPLYASARSTNGPSSKYTLTIYVDEGNHAVFGHVFVELSDGRNDLFYGFYPGFGIRERIHNDRDHRWDVKRSYHIRRDGVRRAIRGIELARSQGQKWFLSRHCGDFAEAVAKTAGVPIELRWQPSGRDRPTVFGKYLRQHGGVLASDDLPRVAVRDPPRVAVIYHELMSAETASLRKLKTLATSACDDGPYLSSQGLSAFLELESEHAENRYINIPRAEEEGTDLSGCSKSVYEHLVTLIRSSKDTNLLNEHSLISQVNAFRREANTPTTNVGVHSSTPRDQRNCHGVTVSLDHRKELWCN